MGGWVGGCVRAGMRVCTCTCSATQSDWPEIRATRPDDVSAATASVEHVEVDAEGGIRAKL